MIDALHFLRPLWLFGLPATALVWWLVRRQRADRLDLGDFVASHLRDALTINRDATSGLRAVDGVAVVLLALSVAAAGPTWSRQASPWFEETAPLVIALEVSDSMRANDVAPNRLNRARFKVLDLIKARTGARTALIAYAGSAHIVMPPTSDYGVLKTYVEGLDPEVMPTPGARAAAALPLAATLLDSDTANATLLYVNDGFDADDIDALSDFAARPGATAVVALIIGTADGGVALKPDGFPVVSESGSPLDTRVDESLLRRVSRQSGMTVVRATAGDSDIRSVLRAIDSNLARAGDPDAEWKDQGWWLLWVAMLGTLAWFRRGWTMRW